MPAKTQMLDAGHFVYSPEAPENFAFLEYLNFADRLLASWHEACEASERSPLSSELAQRREDLDQAVRGFVDSFSSRYTIRAVRQDPVFVPLLQFFAAYRPLRRPFSILHCNLGMPLHTVRSFQDDSSLFQVNAALDEDTPLLWGQPGPNDRPCYLFGACLWELTELETKQSELGLILSFQDLAERHGNGHCGAARVC